MCGRFSQSLSREEYLSVLTGDVDRDIPFDPAPIARYNVAPGTKVLLLNQRGGALHIDPVLWGYAPPWWDKPPLINARFETFTWHAVSRAVGNVKNQGRELIEPVLSPN
nr:SOS response-associated peptidase family protein [Candidatus Erwinia dacicola]